VKPSANDLLKTPVFDRMAKEGARFDNTFVSVPSCTPSRDVLCTGRHFFTPHFPALQLDPTAVSEASPKSKF
jgi:arylsulfatase A-like enzyme